MSNLQTSSVTSSFVFSSKSVRTRVNGEVIWFAAKDICRALDITWSGATLKDIPKGWQGMLRFNTPSGNQQVRVINEAAVYKLAFRSNKPEADEFTNWVVSEVLPALRKTGKYEVAPKTLPAPKQKALPMVHPDSPQGKLDALMKRVAFYINEVKDAGEQISMVMAQEFHRNNPGSASSLRDEVFSAHLYASCSTQSLFQSISFALQSIEASLKVRIKPATGA